jgi:methionine salvage enolase-phosphatase E1
VDRNFSVPARKFIASDNDRVFVSTCINWFYSFTNYMETKLEEDYSIAAFQQWIAKSTEVSPPLKAFAQTFWEKGFKPLLQ